MRDIDAKEMRGHNILAVERFQDCTRWMMEFVILATGEEMRLFLDDAAYQKALDCQRRHTIKIKRYARIIEGHILDFKPKKNRHK